MFVSDTVALIFVFGLASTSAYYVALDQNSAPFLKTWDGQMVDWSMGHIAALTDTSKALRVSSRGMHFYDHAVSPRGDGVWCRRSAVALCVLEDGSMVFPETSLPRYTYGTRHCGSESSNRRLIVNSTVYDISVCDLFQSQLDLIYWKNHLHFDYNLFLPEWAYILTAAAVLYLVISLGQNIARIMGDAQAVTMPRLTELVCVGLVVLLLSLHDPYRIFVADHDRHLFLYVMGYLLLYIFRHGFDIFMEKYVYTFNVITVTLVFVTARLYCSFETPYSTIFFVLLLTRFFHKLLNPTPTPMEQFTLAADAVLIAMYYKLSFVPSFWDVQMASLYAVSILMLCYTVGNITMSQSSILHPLPKL